MSRSSRPDVVLASSDPRGVLSVIRLSKASYRKMVQNLAWGAGYNLVAIPLAAGVFAFAGITLSPAVGAVLMSASTVVVAFNAQLLRRLDLSHREDASQPSPFRLPSRVSMRDITTTLGREPEPSDSRVGRCRTARRQR